MMLGIHLNRKSDINLARQIFFTIKNHIVTGQLQQGEPLPSTRILAKHLKVSRNTVSEAYEMLWTEGFTISKQGAPTTVATGLHLHSEILVQPQTKDYSKHDTDHAILHDFKTGQPDLSFFPWNIWTRMIRHAAENFLEYPWGYSDSKGYEPLCEEIAKWLFRSRGMIVDPQNIYITAGATQAIHLLIDLLYRENCPFVVENPSHSGTRTIIQQKNYPIQWVNVDHDGALIETILSMRWSAVYVTPSHQFPLGGIMPAKRRIDLIQLAKKNDFYIIEDDYDSEFRYIGAPISPIYSIDHSNVIYVGTFSKTLFPALRLGFAIIPQPLQSEWTKRRIYMDVQNPILEQIALTEFLKSRKMDKHIQKMQHIYKKKRTLLLECIHHEFGEKATVLGDASGLHLILQLSDFYITPSFVQECQFAGIRIHPLSDYCNDPSTPTDKILIGYGHLSENQIKEGIYALAQSISNYRQ